MLKENFGDATRQELLRLLPGRTFRGIQQKALNLGLLKRPSEEELRRQVRAGRSLRQMGEQFNLDGKTIHRYCRKYGIIPSPIDDLRFEVSSRPERSEVEGSGKAKTLCRRKISPEA